VPFFDSAQLPRGPAVDVQPSVIGLREIDDQLAAIARWLDAVELDESNPGNVENEQVHSKPFATWNNLDGPWSLRPGQFFR
jgi:hypothetical protein